MHPFKMTYPDGFDTCVVISNHTTRPIPSHGAFDNTEATSRTANSDVASIHEML